MTDTPKRRWYQFTLRGLLLAMALISIYLGSYKALLSPVIVPTEGHLGWAYGYRKPQYRIGGAVSQRVFAPLAWADRRLRPAYWNEYRATWKDFEKECGSFTYGVDQPENAP